MITSTCTNTDHTGNNASTLQHACVYALQILCMQSDYIADKLYSRLQIFGDNQAFIFAEDHPYCVCLCGQKKDLHVACKKYGHTSSCT